MKTVSFIMMFSFIMIYSGTAFAVTGESDGVSGQLSSVLQYVQPESNTWFKTGDEMTINWNSSTIIQVDLSVSTNDGGSWQSLQSGVSATVGRYLWTVEGYRSNECRIRIADAGNESVFVITPGLLAVGGAPQIALSTGSLVFDALMTGETASEQVTIENSGDVPLAIVDASCSNTAFSFEPSAPLSVESGASQAITVTFSPQGEGEYDGTLQLQHNAQGETSEIALSGTGLSYPATYAISHTVNYRGSSSASKSFYEPSDYRLVGLPGNSEKALGGFMNGTVHEDWIAYRYNGNSSNYYEAYDGTEPFYCKTGRAFWVLHKGPLQVAAEVRTATLNSQHEVQIPLVTGAYNLITNPLHAAVNWSDVQLRNNITQTINYYGGASFGPEDEFEAYKGYLFDNRSANLRSLIVPYVLTYRKTSARKAADLVEGEWTVRLIVRSEELSDETARLGVRKGAVEGLDKYDSYKASLPFDLPMIYFERTEWDSVYHRFEADIRGGVTDVERWDFTLHSKNSRQLQLEFPGIETVPEKHAVYLLDKERLTLTDLREHNALEYDAVVTNSQLLLMIGDEEKIKQIAADYIPTEYQLANNYPNPFNPETTIPIHVPFSSNISLAVYNVLGERVATLYEGTLEAGRHYFHWNGREQASGVYLVVLKSEPGVSLVQKMMLMK